MTDDPLHRRYLNLVADLALHDRRYHVESRPVISDQEYDRLYRELREIEAASRVTHPNVVRVHGAGEANGVRYLVTELVAGESLDRKLTTSLDVARAGEIGTADQSGRKPDRFAVPCVAARARRGSRSRAAAGRFGWRRIRRGDD
jgi:hypothetical protein